jgi:hypothetical protein
MSSNKPNFSDFEIEITEGRATSDPQTVQSGTVTKACDPDDAIKIILWASTIIPVGKFVKYFFTAEQVNKIIQTSETVAAGINLLYVFENKTCLDILNLIVRNSDLLSMFNLPESCIQELPQGGFTRSTAGVKWLIKSVLQTAETSNAEVVRVRDWATEMLKSTAQSTRRTSSVLDTSATVAHCDTEHSLYSIVKEYLSSIEKVYTWYPCFLHENFRGISQDEFISQILNYNKTLKMLLGCKSMDTSILENPVFKLIKIPQDTADLLSGSDDSELCAVLLEDIIEEHKKEQEYVEQYNIWKNNPNETVDVKLKSITDVLDCIQKNLISGNEDTMFFSDNFKTFLMLESLKTELKGIISERAKNKSVVEHAKDVFPMIQKYFYKDLAETIICYTL